MKKFLFAIAAVALSAVMLLCGCFEVKDGRDGRDGRDGQDVTIQSVYEKYVEEYGEISFEDFLYKYLGYTNEELDKLTGLQATMNRSLMSGVTILSRFCYSSRQQSSIPGMQSTHRSYQVATGSGAILWLDKAAGDAYVVTNCHVIYDDTSDNSYCDDIRLYLYGQDENGTNFVLNESADIVNDENYRIEAEIVGASVSYDIALLKVSGSEVLKRSDATAASFSSAEDVFVGEFVYAVGNASSEGMSVSDGFISKDSEYISLSLSDRDEKDVNEYRVLRTTAPINHGNSGGALYNARGEIVAIVNAKDEGEDIDNMGYALPASNVKRLLKLMYDNYTANGNKMLRGGGVNKAMLNVTTVITDSYARFNEQTGVAEIVDTVRINSVEKRPARGNIEKDDIIRNIKVTSSDGTVKEDMKVTRRYHVPDIMMSVRSGDTVTLDIERGGEDIVVNILYNSESFFELYK